MTGSELFPIIVKEVDKPLREAVGSTLADVWQGIIGDRLTAWRLRNAAGLNEKLRDAIQRTGSTINLEKIPERMAFAWFDKATEADEPEIQELFATLLANAANGNEDALKRRNTQLVSELTPQEAHLLAVIAELLIDFRSGPHGYRGFKIPIGRFFERTLKSKGLNSDEPVDGLIGLNILRIVNDVGVDRREFTRQVEGLASGSSHALTSFGLNRVISKNAYYVLTTIGESLISALFEVPAKQDVG